MILGEEATHAQIQRILHSKTFRTSEVQRNLLTYLAEKSLSGAADGLKEYTVGLDVFAKPATFDPRQESAVRMHVARLRQKLAEYYRSEGLDDPIFVDLPKGAFKMTFEPRPLETKRTSPRSGSPILLKISLAAALAAAAFLSVRLWQMEPGRPATSSSEAALAWTPELQQLWGPLLNSNRPLMLCLATANGTQVTSVATANGAFLLGQFLAARRQNVLLTRSDMLSMPEITMDNVIFLGPPFANRQMQVLTAGQPIALEPDGIRNLKPQPGEPAFISDRQDAAGEESHALITLMPGVYGHGEILYLAGNHIPGVMAAVQAVTDPALARTLVSKLKNPTGSFPRYYQVVLKVKSMDSMPIEISYILHHELPASKLQASVLEPQNIEKQGSLTGH